MAATLQESVRLFLGRPVDDKKDSVGVRSLHCFSALNNTRKLLDTNQSADGISCLNGIRFLTAIWITFGHVIMETNESNITADTVWQVIIARYNLFCTYLQILALSHVLLCSALEEVDQPSLYKRHCFSGYILHDQRHARVLHAAPGVAAQQGHNEHPVQLLPSLPEVRRPRNTPAKLTNL